MDPLRLTLLLIGILFIAILYLTLRIRSGRPLRVPPGVRNMLARLWPAKRSPAPKTENASSPGHPSTHTDLDDEDIAALSRMSLPPRGELDISDLDGLSAVSEEEAVDGEPLIVVFNIMARQNQRFAGLDVLDALYANDLVHGQMRIFHRYVDPANPQQQPIFSVANTVEPGSFDLDTIEQLQTPGLSLFMQLPGPLHAREAFELMLDSGRNIARQLNGEFCDETRSVLTVQTIGHIKERIEAYLFKQKMARVQQHRR
jgi:cell division protein ZipA